MTVFIAVFRSKSKMLQAMSKSHCGPGCGATWNDDLTLMVSCNHSVVMSLFQQIDDEIVKGEKQLQMF